MTNTELEAKIQGIEKSIEDVRIDLFEEVDDSKNDILDIVNQKVAQINNDLVSIKGEILTKIEGAKEKHNEDISTLVEGLNTAIDELSELNEYLRENFYDKVDIDNLFEENVAIKRVYFRYEGEESYTDATDCDGKAAHLTLKNTGGGGVGPQGKIGPQGYKGAQGEKGEKGDPGSGAEPFITEDIIIKDKTIIKKSDNVSMTKAIKTLSHLIDKADNDIDLEELTDGTFALKIKGIGNE